MNSKQLYFGLLGSCGVLVILLGVVVYFGMGMLQDKSEELRQAKVEQEVVDMQELSLIQARADIEEYSELEAVSRRIIPQEKDQARTVREIIAIAEQAGVPIATISFPSSSLGQQAAAQAGGETANQIITQAEPVPNLPGLLELNMTVQVNEPTSYDRFIAFLEGLERNRRTSQVQSVSISPDSNDRNLISFNINMAVYLRP